MSATSSFDPFRASDPPVLVHDVDLSEFERAWGRDPAAGDAAARCPICGRGTVEERGVAELSHRAWVRFSCGDFITQESTAG